MRLSFVNLVLVVIIIMLSFIFTTNIVYKQGYSDGYSDAKSQCLLKKSIEI